MGESDDSGHEPDGPPRSVAQEAALLVDLLAQRGSFGVPGSAHAGAHDGPHDQAYDQTTRAPRGDDEADAPECTCGGTTPAACRICPVCQLVAFVQKINPETIERIADFAAFAASALRDVATAQRSTSDASSPRTAPTPTPDAADPAAPKQDRSGAGTERAGEPG